MEANGVLGGKYRLISPLGEGAMGTVWLARHEALDSEVAVKVIRKGIDDPMTRQRLFAEARATVAVNSPHVVKVFDYGVEGDQPYIVMERLIGETLDHRLKAGPKLKPELVDSLVSQLARGLGKAHEVGLIHRDLKPANIFLVDNGDELLVKMLDFGIVKYTGQNSALDIEATDTRELMGSPLYMSPEQAFGGREIDHRSDLWSLAVIIMACLTGRWVFRGADSAETLTKICRDDPDLTGIDRYPPSLETWAKKALDKDPNKRFQSARQLSDEFRLALFAGPDSPSPSQTDTQPIAPVSQPPTRQTHDAVTRSMAPPFGKRLGMMGVLLSLLAVIAVGLAVRRVWQWSQKPTQPVVGSKGASSAGAPSDSLSQANAPATPPPGTQTTSPAPWVPVVRVHPHRRPVVPKKAPPSEDALLKERH
ncbi:MAG TPA: protein kinase [Polyangiaceae bacterium]|nr:protein kinase [Polyangiaceae bacterium]